MATKKIKAYKVFDKDIKCLDYQFILGKLHKHTGELIPCVSGFHACEKLMDCFRYKFFHLSMRVFEVELSGITIQENDKWVAEKIKLVRELSFYEIDELVNEGKYNLGHGNIGDHNIGDHNIGDHNIGDHNIGDWNKGEWNKGDWNKGEWNKGDSNKGDHSKGNGNKGNGNKGNGNKGDCNKGDCNKGDCNKGDWNMGDCNTGNGNKGNNKDNTK